MPIYEFYCRACHTVFSFFSSRVDTGREPNCPRCGAGPLPRRPSRFATLKRAAGAGDAEAGDDDLLAGLDESRLEGAMDTLVHEMEGLGEEEDPRAMGRMMRRFGELTGLELGDRLQDYVRRLETGEDPDAVEESMGDDFGDEAGADELFKLKQAIRSRHERRPRIDEELHFL